MWSAWIKCIYYFTMLFTETFFFFFKRRREGSYQRGSPCQDPSGSRTTRRPPDHRKKTQTAVVWSCLPFMRSDQNRLARHSERGKKTRQTEEEMGTTGNGQAWSSASPRGQWRTGKNGGNWLQPQRPSRLRDRWDEMTSVPLNFFVHSKQSHDYICPPPWP